MCAKKLICTNTVFHCGGWGPTKATGVWTRSRTTVSPSVCSKGIWWFGMSPVLGGKASMGVPSWNQAKVTQHRPWIALACAFWCVCGTYRDILKIHSIDVYFQLMLSVVPKWYISETLFGPRCSPRFGRALSKVRSKHQKRNYRLAVQFLRSAKKSTNEFDTRPRINKMWSKHCQLQPLMDFLATKR